MIGFFEEEAVGYTPYREDHVHKPTVQSKLEESNYSHKKATLAGTRFNFYQSSNRESTLRTKTWERWLWPTPF